jgi:hypothetical protein
VVLLGWAQRKREKEREKEDERRRAKEEERRSNLIALLGERERPFEKETW